MLYVSAMVIMSINPGVPTDIPKAWESLEVFQNYNPDLYWGTVLRSMFSLLNLVLMAEYSEFVRPMYFDSPVSWFFLTAFAFFTVFGILNVLLGMIMENMHDASEAMKP